VGLRASLDTMENRVSFTHVTKRFPCPAHGLVTIATKLFRPPYIQDVPGGKFNILGGHSIGHSKQKCLFEHVSYSERFPR